MKNTFVFILALTLVVLTACSGNNDEETNNSDELKALEVEFEVPETAEVNETILLKAIVTYGDEMVEDADDVSFEYWEEGNQEDSTTVESINNRDGTYTAEITLENNGIFSIYAHTTARGLHTMPMKSVTVEQSGGE